MTVIRTNKVGLDYLRRLREWTYTSIAQPDPAPFGPNLRGMLTGAQIRQLMDLERPLTPEEASLCDRAISTNSVYGILLMLVLPTGICLLLTLRLAETGNSPLHRELLINTVNIICILLLVGLAISLWLIFRPKGISFDQVRRQGDLVARATYAAYVPLTQREDIQQSSGSITLSERTSSTAPYTVEIDGKRFNISEELWNWLRRSKGTFIANTLITPHHGEVLLSIQPDTYVPPDETRGEQ
ncbi:MAG TPA: hypothetical protein PLQ56_24405 [Aggregatilineales bacterium]|nr:hypothetical protein [Aggregatilineales bacterium]